MMLQLTQPMATIIGALIAAIAGFLGAWFGVQLALSRFKKERAFDRQIDWYERVIRSLHDMAQKIDIAATFQREPKTPPQHLIKCWRDVQRCHLLLEAVVVEAELYGSSAAAKIAADVFTEVQDVADATEAFDPNSWKKADREAMLSMIEELPDKLRTTSKPLAEEFRTHMGLDNPRQRLTSG
jgi:hypothetical protein